MFAERIPIFRDENILSATSGFNAVKKCHFAEWKIGKGIGWRGRGSFRKKAKEKRGKFQSWMITQFWFRQLINIKAFAVTLLVSPDSMKESLRRRLLTQGRFFSPFASSFLCNRKTASLHWLMAAQRGLIWISCNNHISSNDTQLKTQFLTRFFPVHVVTAESFVVSLLQVLFFFVSSLIPSTAEKKTMTEEKRVLDGGKIHNVHKAVLLYCYNKYLNF